jgi:hypothetical protein
LAARASSVAKAESTFVAPASVLALPAAPPLARLPAPPALPPVPDGLLALLPLPQADKAAPMTMTADRGMLFMKYLQEVVGFSSHSCAGPEHVSVIPLT